MSNKESSVKSKLEQFRNIHRNQNKETIVEEIHQKLLHIQITQTDIQKIKDEFSKQRFSDKGQRAIISYCTIKFIMNIEQDYFLQDSRSIRERILEGDHLIQSILGKAKAYVNEKEQAENLNDQADIQITQSLTFWDPKLIDLQAVGFSQNNIDEVLKAFDINSGIKYNQYIWSQESFKTGQSQDNRLTLMPSLITGKIMNVIINQRHSDRYTTFGQKGTGKSFAFFIYDYLATFLIDYRISLINNSEKHSEMFYLFVPQAEFLKFKRLFYISIRQCRNLEDFWKRFEEQYPIRSKALKIQKEMEQDQKIKIMQYLFTWIQYDYQQLNVPTVCIIDEANAYYSQFRQMLANNKTESIYVKAYSQFLDCLMARFSLIISNSSQEDQSRLISRFNWNNRNRPYFDPYYHERCNLTYLNIQYNSLFSNNTGHISLYSWLWDELCKYFQTIKLFENRLARQCFQQAFGLPEASGSSSKDLVWWKYDVRLTNITNSLKTSMKRRIISQDLLNQGDKNAIIKAFINTKQIIEKERLQQLTICFAQYKSQSPTQLVKMFRHQILRSFVEGASQTSWENRTCVFIKVDFQKDVQYFKDRFQSQGYTIDKEIRIITQELGTGYRSQKKPTRFGFLIDRQVFFTLSNILYNNLDELKEEFEFHITNKSTNYKFGEDYLNAIHYYFFQEGIQQFRVMIREPPTTFTIKHYSIFKSFPFQATIQKLIRRLKPIIDFAIKNKDKSILGFPVLFRQLNQEQTFKYNVSVIQGNQSQIKKINHIFIPHHPDFDFLIIMISQNNEIIVHSFDDTIGNLQNKINQLSSEYTNKEDKNKLQFTFVRYIQQFYLQYNMCVQWQHKILTCQSSMQHWLGTNQHGIIHDFIRDENTEQVRIDNKKVGSFKLGLAAFKADTMEDHCLLEPSKYELQETLMKELKKIIDQTEKLKKRYEYNLQIKKYLQYLRQLKSQKNNKMKTNFEENQ